MNCPPLIQSPPARGKLHDINMDVEYTSWKGRESMIPKSDILLPDPANEANSMLIMQKFPDTGLWVIVVLSYGNRRMLAYREDKDKSWQLNDIAASYLLYIFGKN